MRETPNPRLASGLAVTVLMAALLTLPGVHAKGTKSASSKATPAPRSTAQLSNAAPSVDALVGRFMEALEQKDRAKLQGLRVTESEYLDVIMPGSIEPGKPLKNYDHHDQASQYFWGILDTKSRYLEVSLLDKFGGTPLKIKSVKYQRGVKDYATYRAYKQLRLLVERSDGTEDELETGSIAEVNGQYKFISFIHD